MADNDIIPDDDDVNEEESENEDVLEETGGDRRDPTTGSVMSDEDLSGIAEEITGRAASTEEDLTTLFRNASGTHVADGFRGGSDEEGLEENPGEVPTER
jgi:hypothetical protein